MHFSHSRAPRARSRTRPRIAPSRAAATVSSRPGRILRNLPHAVVARLRARRPRARAREIVSRTCPHSNGSSYLGRAHRGGVERPHVHLHEAQQTRSRDVVRRARALASTAIAARQHVGRAGDGVAGARAGFGHRAGTARCAVEATLGTVRVRDAAAAIDGSRRGDDFEARAR